MTWAMSQAPRGEVRENVLARLIAPHGDIARKRVTLLYRVIDPGEAARIVERDLHNAEFRVNSAARPTARAVVEQSAARATAQEEARGAALVNFGMLVTATVLDPEELQLRQGGRGQSRADRAGQSAAGVGLAGLGVRRGAPGRAVSSGASEDSRAGPASAVSARIRPAPQPKPQGPSGPVLPGPRGWHGPGAGAACICSRPRSGARTSVQACGLWPFSVGAGAPLIGAPLGKHLLTGATVCGDPISWFQRAGLLTAPTAFVMGLQGFGKSSLHPPDGAGPGRVRGPAAGLGRSEARLRRPDRRPGRSGDHAWAAAAGTSTCSTSTSPSAPPRRLGDGEHAKAQAGAARRRGRPPAHDGLRADLDPARPPARTTARTRCSPPRCGSSTSATTARRSCPICWRRSRAPPSGCGPRRLTAARSSATASSSSRCR